MMAHLHPAHIHAGKRRRAKEERERPEQTAIKASETSTFHQLVKSPTKELVGLLTLGQSIDLLNSLMESMVKKR